MEGGALTELRLPLTSPLWLLTPTTRDVKPGALRPITQKRNLRAREEVVTRHGTASLH